MVRGGYRWLQVVIGDRWLLVAIGGYIDSYSWLYVVVDGYRCL